MDKARGNRVSAMADRQTEEALAWFARLRRANAGASDQAAFEAWRDAGPGHADAFRRVEALWESEELATALRSDPLPEARAVAVTVPVARCRRRPILRYAAAIALLLLCFGLVRAIGLETDFDGGDYRTAVGETERVTLADGSVMQLNTATAVALAMDGGHRRIRLLRGEGYFSVAHDAGRPFEVDAGPVRVVVLGTAFAVRRDGDDVVVAVRRGRVSVNTGGAGGEFLLGAGERLRIAPGERALPGPFDPAVEFAWLENRVVFRDRPLRAVLAQVRRYRDGWLFVAGEALGDTRVSGSYRLDDPAAIVDALADAAKGEVLRLPGGVIVVH